MKKNRIQNVFNISMLKWQIRSILLTLATCLLTHALLAQAKGNKKKEDMTTEYDRVSITPLLIDAKDSRVAAIFNKYKISDKYFDHSLSYNHIIFDDSDSTQMVGGSKISKDIISKWYSRDVDHTFSMKLFEDRGLYNATDAMVLADQGAKVSRLKDLGERLIKKSYVFVFHFYAIEKIVYEKEKREGYKVKLKASIYKVDWSDSLASVFYNKLWMEKNDPDAANKINEFDNTRFPMVSVTTMVMENSSTESTEGSKRLSDNEVFSNAVSPLIEKVYFEAERKIEDFKVKSALYTEKPLTAKIGLKEGVSVDQRYFVYEFVLDKHNNKKARRKGVIRATGKVADNREINTGQSLTSRFYQVGGRKLREGMLLKQNSDLGVGLLLGVGSFSGAQAESFIRLGLDYNFSSLISRNFPPGIHIFLSANFSAPKYDYFKTVNDAFNINTTEDAFENDNVKKDFKTQNIELNIGLSKDYFFARNFCFTPSLSYQLGWVTLVGKHKLVKATSPKDFGDVDPSKDPYKSKSLSENKGVNVGGSLYINITHNFKLYFSGSYTVKLGTKVGDVFSTYILPESVTKSKNGAYLSSGIKILW